jgi:hypothetical protein
MRPGAKDSFLENFGVMARRNQVYGLPSQKTDCILSHSTVLRIRNTFQTSLCRLHGQNFFLRLLLRVGFPEVHETFPKGTHMLSRGTILRDYFPNVLSIE